MPLVLITGFTLLPVAPTKLVEALVVSDAFFTCPIGFGVIRESAPALTVGFMPEALHGLRIIPGLCAGFKADCGYGEPAADDGEDDRKS
jgi:hypothetical protein